jgi:hypothetical protein
LGRRPIILIKTRRHTNQNGAAYHDTINSLGAILVRGPRKKKWQEQVGEGACWRREGADLNVVLRVEELGKGPVFQKRAHGLGVSPSL